MTVQELYTAIGGNYEAALRVMVMDKLIDKHIRKLPDSPSGKLLEEAAVTMDPVQLFDAAHAMKGVCGNLGLEDLAQQASQLAEEFRSGNARKLTDDDAQKLAKQLLAKFQSTVARIQEYAGQA